ncbi:MAG: VTC domain-containing protein [Verrucomicrobia bacterium]|nr:VTC domain-containing protein [Verrucomicrobiota bacterium]MCH8525813.1 VTC domain-containing protein [Kiritimatiellia bacterium]
MTLSIERKFVADARKAGIALDLAEHYCLPDGEFPDNTIGSIYYDNPRLSAFQHKVEGDHIKKKVRLRWYGHFQPNTSASLSPVYLECKHRLGAARIKERVRVEVSRDYLEHAALTDRGFVDLLRRQAEWNEDVLPLDLRPLLCIRYERRRFRCPRSGARVAIDWQIRVDRVNRDLLPASHCPLLPSVVCEFKDNGLQELPWAPALYAAGFRLKSFSKFGSCILMLQNGGL